MFWKTFACIALAIASYVGISAANKWNGLTKMSETVSEPQFARQMPMLYQLQKDQAEPAFIVLKGSSSPVTGYYANEDGRYLYLVTVYKEKETKETVAIPWENVQYIQITNIEKK